MHYAAGMAPYDKDPFVNGLQNIGSNLPDAWFQEAPRKIYEETSPTHKKVDIVVRDQFLTTYLIPHGGTAPLPRKDWLVFVRGQSVNTHTALPLGASMEPPLTCPLCSASTETLTGNDSGACLETTAGKIHLSWYVRWIALSQDWVGEQMVADQKALEVMARNLVLSRRPTAFEPESTPPGHAEAWMQDAKAKLLKKNPLLIRFHELPPAMMVIFDFRSIHRTARAAMLRARRLSQDNSAPFDSDDSGDQGQQQSRYAVHMESPQVADCFFVSSVVVPCTARRGSLSSHSDDGDGSDDDGSSASDVAGRCTPTRSPPRNHHSEDEDDEVGGDDTDELPVFAADARDARANEAEVNQLIAAGAYSDEEMKSAVRRDSDAGEEELKHTPEYKVAAGQLNPHSLHLVALCCRSEDSWTPWRPKR